jgi:hypothetical protein
MASTSASPPRTSRARGLASDRRPIAELKFFYLYSMLPNTCNMSYDYYLLRSIFFLNASD